MDNFIIKVTKNSFIFTRAVKLEDGVYRLVLLKKSNEIGSVLSQRDIMINFKTVMFRIRAALIWKLVLIN